MDECVKAKSVFIERTILVLGDNKESGRKINKH